MLAKYCVAIKRIKQILIFLLSVIAALLLFINLLLNFPPIQTWLAHRAASYVSAKLHAKVQIGKVNFEFLKKMVLQDIYIEDLHKDTLFFAKSLKLDIGALNFDKHTLIANDIIIDQPKVHFYYYKGDSDISLQFIIDALTPKTKDTSHTKKARWDINVGSLVLNDADFMYQIQDDTSTNTGIKFDDMRVHHIYLRATDIHLPNDTLRGTIENISATEQSGFRLDKFSCYVKLSSTLMQLNALNIETPQTKISTDLIFRYSRFPDFFDFLNKVDMQASFRESKVCFEDLAYFGHALYGVNNCLTLSGQYSGKINKLKGRNMIISWGNTFLRGDAALQGLPDIDRTLMKINITRLITSKADVEALPIPPFNKHEHIKLPDNFTTLGTVELSGSFDGYISNFKANMEASSAIGKVYGSLSMRQDTLHNDMAYYKGTLGTSGFDIGRFWQVKDLGAITSSVSIEGKGLTRNDADAQITGTIDGFGFKKYNYKNLSLSGELRKGFFSGLLEVDDPNLQMTFNGDIDLASQTHSYHFNSYVSKADLVKMNLIHDTTGQVVLSTHMEVDLRGNKLDDIDGYVHLDSTHLAYHKDNYHLRYLNATSISNKGDYHAVTVFSDYADAKISGRFPLTQLPGAVQNMMALYIPSKFQKDKLEPNNKEDRSYDFDIKFKENTGLTNLFVPSLKMAKGTTIEGYYREKQNTFSLTGQSGLIEWTSRKLKHWNLYVTGNSSSLEINTNADTLFVSDSLYAAGFNVKGKIANDTTHYAIKWNNDSSNFADIPGYIAFGDKSQISFGFLNPILSLNDSVWQANSQNLVTIDTSGVTARSMEFFHLQQSISIRGKLSKQKNDAMVVTVHKLNLKDFNIGNIINIQGTVDGTVSVANVYSPHPFFAGALNFNRMVFNGQSLGDGSVNSYWDNEAQAIAINGEFVYHDTTLLSFNGDYYDRDTNNLSLDATMHQLPVKIFQTYIKDYCSQIEGSVSGSARVYGSLNKPLLSGKVTADIKRVKFDYLNTYYHSSDLEIAISPDTFKLLPSPLLDDRQDTAIASGTVTHNHFKNIRLDFNMDASNFLCLNTNESMNSSYYGIGYATGNVQIYGPVSSLHIDANITTNKGTQFNIPLSNASEVDQGDFIRFVSKNDTVNKMQQAYKVKLGGLQMNFTVHATPDASAQLIFAQKVGDIMYGRGSGTIQLNMNTQGEFSMRGEYRVVDGTYDFTLRNTFSKKFIIEDGGTINWSGDPYNADINLNAIYSKRTSLAPLFPDDTTGVYKKLFPYNCDMYLTGKLTAPQIKFNIDLPTVDEASRQIVDGYLSNGDEMNRQVFSLLILNSFLPVQERANNTSIVGTAGLNSTEFLSDQLNNMLSSISNKYQLGVKYQPGTAVNSTELQVMFSTQLFNDRVSITGDAGTAGNTITPTPQQQSDIVGEVTVEYKVSKDGKVKVKAYNKANDNTVINFSNSPYTQGVGISYRESFNSIGELIDKIKSKLKRKKAPPPVPVSTK
jgi:hypothetical protein